MQACTAKIEAGTKAADQITESTKKAAGLIKEIGYNESGSHIIEKVHIYNLLSAINRNCKYCCS